MPDEERKRVSGYGIASAVLGVLAIVGVVLSVMIWTQHREQTAELRYRTQVLQAAADWTGVLINMNSDTVESDLATLHEGTVGQLNADFDATVEPYRRLVQTLRRLIQDQKFRFTDQSMRQQHPLVGVARPRQ